MARVSTSRRNNEAGCDSGFALEQLRCGGMVQRSARVAGGAFTGDPAAVGYCDATHVIVHCHSRGGYVIGTRVSLLDLPQYLARLIDDERAIRTRTNGPTEWARTGALALPSPMAAVTVAEQPRAFADFARGGDLA